MKYKVKLWGVMGSCPGGKKELLEYGSNTSSVTIMNNNTLVIFDCGSGIVGLGHSDIDFTKFKKIVIFITHYHYDHIIGMPFFSLFYNPNLNISIYAPRFQGLNSKDVLSMLFKEPFLPMNINQLKANIEYNNIEDYDTVKVNDLEIDKFRTDHPGINYAYRVKKDNHIFSYITDLEHSKEIDESLIEFVRNSTNIYYDSNFTDEEKYLPRYEGWGHSSHSKGIKLMFDSNSKNIYLGHHGLHRKLKELIEVDEATPENVIIAKEGMEFDL
ncbi:MBL fold metallo-hydrolase [Helicovermis profundi]|uniref:MBL fold metallo-hydrolase n=1 Tax=Helicovermis profundi TaxID=3065157 RepID=A0AAU9E546_9FIRM|nr:MBL fold metallo-hydrolase [Clostridia bacterium S502]